VSLESSNSQAMDSGSEDTDVKPKKKPGRKMMTTEPANVCFPFPFMSDVTLRNERPKIELLKEHSENERKLMSRDSRLG
jgi:hypothetical protein